MSLLKAAGESFLRTFLVTFAVLIPGILAAPNLSEAPALAGAASIAALIAALKALQVYVPQLSIGYLLTKFIGVQNKAFEAYEDTFARTFVGTLIAALFGVLSAPDLGTARSLFFAAIIGALSTAVKSITQNIGAQKFNPDGTAA